MANTLLALGAASCAAGLVASVRHRARRRWSFQVDAWVNQGGAR